MIEPKVSDSLQKVHTRVLSVTYDGSELTLEMLRDFVTRTRNQRMIPNWDPETVVSIEPSDDGTWVFSVTEQQREQSQLTPRKRYDDVPLPLEDDE